MEPSSFDRVLDEIQDRIGCEAGLLSPRWVLRERLLARMEALQVDAPRYLARLSDKSEFSKLIDLLRVGETRFFRHDSHTKVLHDHVLPFLAQSTTKVRVWSAGCATGEEPYSLAMLLRRSLGDTRPIQIDACDISESSLDFAKAASYPNAIRSQIPARLHDYLQRDGEARTKICPQIRELVRFSQRNLHQGSFPAACDVVFCRNVLIYFSAEARAQALAKLVQSLKPGGFLFVGYSESLREIDGLEAIPKVDASVYRRKAREYARPRPMVVKDPLPTARPLANPLKRPPKPALLRLEGDYSNSNRLAEEIHQQISQRPATLTIDIDGAEYLGEEEARVLTRCQKLAESEEITLRFQSKRDGHTRFLRRHKLIARDPS